MLDSASPIKLKPATQLAIFYADRRDRRKSPGVPGAAIAIFADSRDRRIKSPISGMSDIGYLILSRDFLRLLLRIASKANPSGWAILSHEFSKLPHRSDRRKKSPGVSASTTSDCDQIRCDRRIKSPGVSPA